MVVFRVDIVADPSPGVRSAKKVERALRRTGNEADRLRKSLFRAFAVFGGITIITNIVRTLADFEQALSTVRAITGATEDQFKDLTETAKELGISTRFSATQAGEGMEFLARAGFEVEEVLAAIGPVLNLAQAGALDFASAANIASNVLKGFRLEAEETSRVVDVLAAAAASSNTDVRKLGQALSFTAPIAASMGISVEEAAAAIGVLGDAGIPATRAGRGLNLVLSALEKGSDGLADAVARAGLNLSDIRPSAVGIADALRNLEKANIGAGESFDLFGRLGAPAFNVLQFGSDRIAELTEELEESGGAAAEMARIMDDNLKGSLLRVRSAFQGLILELGKGGALSSIFDSLAAALRFAAENADVLLATARNLALILGPRVLLGAVRTLIAVAAANPFGLMIVAASTLIALVPDLQDKFDALVASIGQIGETVAGSFDFTGTLETVAGFVDDTVGLFNGMLAASGAVFDAIGAQPAVAGELIKKGFRDAVEASLKFFLAFAQTVGFIILGIGDDVISLARNVGGAIGAISSGNLAAAQSFADNLESTLLRTGNRVATFTGQFQGNLRKLQDVDILPVVELSRDAVVLGDQVANEFRRGIQETPRTASEVLADLLGAADLEEIVKVAEDLGKEVVDLAKPPTGGGESGEEPISAKTRELIKELDIQNQITTANRELNDVLDARPDLQNEVNKRILETKIAALEASDALGDGFTRAFLKIQLEANDLAAVGEKIVNVFADEATDAILEFTETGVFEFKKFASSILDELKKILVRLLVVQAINLVTGGVGGLATRASGGPLAAGQTALVGERGPELFVPSSAGNVIPAPQTAALMAGPAAPPQVNVSVVNVRDESEVASAIADGEADDAIVNVLARNREAVRQVVG